MSQAPSVTIHDVGISDPVEKVTFYTGPENSR